MISDHLMVMNMKTDVVGGPVMLTEVSFMGLREDSFDIAPVP